MQNVIRKLFCFKSLLFFCAIKELVVWEGFGSSLVILAIATTSKIVEDFCTISISLEDISVGIVCGDLLKSVLTSHELGMTLLD